MPQHKRTHDERIAVTRESLRVRCTQAIQALVPMSVGLMGVGALLWSECDHARLLAWLVSCFAMTVLAAVDCIHILKRLDSAPEDALAGFNARFLVTTVLNTLAVGSGVWWVAAISSPEIGFFVTLCLCFYAIGHTINGSSYLPSFFGGMFVNLGQVMAFWLVPGADGIGIALLLACIVYLLCTFAIQSAKSFAESIRMRFDNLDLVAALSEEKKMVERALAAAEEANHAKSRFLAAASHDLRQPLHALGLWAGLLRDSLTAPAALERADKMISSVESLDKMFSGLLDLSRLDGGGITPEKRKLSLRQVFKGLENDFRGEAQAKGIDLRVTAPNAWVYTDPLWFERVLRNLLANAIRYTQHGSVSLWCEENADTVRVIIRDTGIGIGAAEQQRIFEEYYQAHNPARDRNLGVGLGLAIVKRACDLLGHPISVRSELGAGSEFSVAVPRCSPEAATAREEARSETSAAELLDFVVVVVEDDPDVIDAMREMLLEWRCCPVMCESAAAAITALSARRLHPQAIVTDYRLRGNLTGLDVIETLRAKYGAVPAALVTGEINIAGSEEKILDYVVLQKPLAPARIRNLLLQFRLSA